MADSILRLKVDSQEYDNKIKRAAEGIKRYADGCRAAGGTLEFLDEGVLEFVKSLGKMDTVMNSTRGQVREMSQALTDLTTTYRSLSDEEKSSPFGQELAKSIEALTERAGQAQDAMSDVQASIKNAASDTRVFDQVSGGIQMMTSSFQTAQGAAKLLGIELGDNVEVLAKLQAAMAVTSGLREVQALLQKQSALMMGINALQMKFNILAKVNPYVLLAGAVTAVAGAFALFTSGADEAAEAQEKLNKEVEHSLWQLDEIKRKADFDVAIAEAAGKSWDEIHELRLEAAKLQEDLAFKNMQSSIGAGKEANQKAVRAYEEAVDNYNKVLEEGIIHYVREKSKKTSGGGGGGGRITGKSSAPVELLPQYSVAGLTEDLKYLQQEQQKATNPDEWRTYEDAIRSVGEEIKKVKGELSSLGTDNTTGGISISGLLSEQNKKDEAAFRNKKINVTIPAEKEKVDTTQKVGELVGSVSSIVNSLNQLGVEIPKGFSNVLSGMQVVITILEAIQTIQTVGSILGIFHNGGIVPHAASGYMVPGTHYSNDVTPVLANAGELILSKSQQGNLAAQLSGTQSGYAAQPYVNGEMILLGTNNHLRRSGQGEIVTTKMLKSMGLIN